MNGGRGALTPRLRRLPPPRASFALLDAAAGTFEVHRVDYDVDAAVQAIETAGLPAFNGERLRDGM